MRPHAAVSGSHENYWDQLYPRAQDLFVDSEAHSIIGSIEYFLSSEEANTTEAEVKSRLRNFSPAPISNTNALNVLLKASNQGPDAILGQKIHLLYAQKTMQLLNNSLKECSFISQTTSWSRLRISLEMFVRLVQVCNVFEEFSNHVFQFGKRIQSGPETSITSHMRLHANKSSIAGYEICYNLKHFELHGRELKNPWSCRHAAFYQRYSFTKQRSTWIIIQGPSKINSYLERSVLAESKTSSTCYMHPLYLHVQIIRLLERNWTGYLVTLEEQRRRTSEKMTFLGHCETSVDLQDVHYINAVQDKLRTAIAIIQGIKSVISTVVDLCELQQDHTNQGVQVPWSPSLSSLVVAELNQLLNTFQNHMHTASKILQSSDDVKVMVLAIIAHRQNDTIRMHTISLDSFASKISAESQHRTQIASRALLESSVVRIATLITVFYLPFNLTTAFFSTNLIRFQEQGTIKLQKSIWVFIVMTLILSGGTTVAFWVWKRLEKAGSGQHASP